MLYLIGLGLNFDSISSYGLKVAKRCKKLYIEDYTINFPYSKKKLSEVFGKKVIPADRKFVESLELVDLAAKQDIALLVYGSPLTATTHITLLNEAKNSKVKAKVIYSASILDGVGETGLQLYKFGKVTSMPKWDSDKGFTPDSFIETIKENHSINAHSLILIDIDLKFPEAINQLKASAEKHKFKLKDIIICQCLGTAQSKVLYRPVSEVDDYRIRLPYCIIIPGKLHFAEKEYLENFESKRR